MSGELNVFIPLVNHSKRTFLTGVQWLSDQKNHQTRGIMIRAGNRFFMSYHMSRYNAVIIKWPLFKVLFLRSYKLVYLKYYSKASTNEYILKFYQCHFNRTETISNIH